MVRTQLSARGFSRTAASILAESGLTQECGDTRDEKDLQIAFDR
jgi:hypothetical protein